MGSYAGDKKNLDLQQRFCYKLELMATIRNQKELEKWQFRVESNQALSGAETAGKI